MAEFVRKAGAIWSGDARNGSGIVSTESKAIFEAPYKFSTRFGDEPGANPEELIAAAHAACFAMALASTLKKNGFDPKQVESNASVTVASKDGGFEINHMSLHVRADVPGIDDATFQRLVKEADQGCPVSNLLRNGLKIDIKSDLIMVAEKSARR